MSQQITAKRELKIIASQISHPPTEGFAAEPLAWLTNQARLHKFWFLLAHADDGLIWGKVDDTGGFSLSDAKFKVSPPLNIETLQQLRLFGPAAELHVWRSDDTWQSRLLVDGDGEARDYFDEPQILWGSKRLAEKDGFTLVVEGEQGHRHAVPILVAGQKFARKNNPLRLQVRHYLTEDEPSGQLRITLSRLIDITVEDPQ